MSGSNGELEKLRFRLEEVRNKLDLLRREIKSWSAKRRSTIEELKALRERIREARTKRDSINKTVKLLKAEREDLKAWLKDYKHKLSECKEKFKVLRGRRPEGSVQTLEKQLEEIEWKIQTTPLPLREEKILVDRAKEVGAKLGVLKRITALKEEERGLRQNVRELKMKINSKSEVILKLASQSQEAHSEMLRLIEKADGLRMRAKNESKKLAEVKEKLRVLSEEYKSIKNELKRRLEEKKLREEKERREKATRLLKQLREQASEKFKRGEKLTWEEFRLLSN